EVLAISIVEELSTERHRGGTARADTCEGVRAVRSYVAFGKASSVLELDRPAFDRLRPRVLIRISGNRDPVRRREDDEPFPTVGRLPFDRRVGEMRRDVSHVTPDPRAPIARHGLRDITFNVEGEHLGAADAEVALRLLHLDDRENRLKRLEDILVEHQVSER